MESSRVRGQQAHGPAPRWLPFSCGLALNLVRGAQLQGALHARPILNAVLLGLTADAAMNVKAEHSGGLPIGDAVPAGLFLDYTIALPGYGVDASRYEWALQVYRPGQSSGETIASGRNGGTNGPLPPPVSWKRPGYHPETTVPVIRHDPASGTLGISGSISFFGAFEVHAIELEVSYWPDKSDESGVARLIVKEDKIGEWKGAPYEKA